MGRRAVNQFTLSASLRHAGTEMAARQRLARPTLPRGEFAPHRAPLRGPRAPRYREAENPRERHDLPDAGRLARGRRTSGIAALRHVRRRQDPAAPCCATTGDWFHYSVDYRIGTRYMGEFIVDNFKREAMKVPFLRDLLRSDSIYIASNITFDNLEPLSTYLGKPGDPARAACPSPNTSAARSSTASPRSPRCSTCVALHRARRGPLRLSDFISDTGGSLRGGRPRRSRRPGGRGAGRARCCCSNPRHARPIREELVRRFDRAPKPMYYQPRLPRREMWAEYKARNRRRADDEVDPDAFVRLGLAGAAGAPAAALPGAGRQLRRHRRGRRARDGARRRRVRRPHRARCPSRAECVRLARRAISQLPRPNEADAMPIRIPDDPARLSTSDGTRASWSCPRPRPRGRTSARCRSACST